MSVDLSVPWLEDEHIENKANEFLLLYHPTETIPIPIEEIIEFDLKLDITLLPNLERQIDGVSALTQDMKTIFIDEYVCNSTSNYHRYRFSLAHEVGHICLHADIYKQIPCNSVYDWKQFILEIPPKQYDRMEYQANQFAGLVLVPRTHLMSHFKEAESDLKANGHDPKEYYELFEDYLYKVLTRLFRVSKDVLTRRARFEGLEISL